MHESGVINTVDPLGGSWFVERLTNDMEADVLREFERIDQLGGVIPAIENGYFHRAILDSSQRFQREVESGERVIVGVNAYQSGGLDDVPLLEMDVAGRDRHLARLAAWKRDRDASAWADAMARLDTASKSPADNTMPYIIDAVKAGATVGEISGAWRAAYGEFREIMV
jgi:methylmalonyl-CoA mutase N-terminal domain/subunit